MCLAFPVKVLEIRGDTALIDKFGEKTEVPIGQLEGVPKVGEYLQMQSGIPVSILGKKEGEAALKEWEKLTK